jgi:GNAT superfamily N-acetyltransferase
MAAAATTALVDAQWAAILGCSVDDLCRPQTLVVPQGTLAGYQGVMVLRRGAACIVSVPLTIADAMRQRIAGRTADQVFDVSCLVGLFGNTVERIVGPAWQGYADSLDFQPADTRGTHLLQLGDEEALRRLAQACDQTEWEHSAIVWGKAPIFGCFAGNDLVAGGILDHWGARVLSAGIITHPAHRGRGYGRAVVSAMTVYGLSQGAALRYQTLQANTASMAIAQALGYREYGRTLAVRLTRLDVE